MPASKVNASASNSLRRLAYAAADYLTLQAKYFVTERLHARFPYLGTSLSATERLRDVNRLQLDAVLKF